MDRRAALAHAFRSCRYAPHRSVSFAGAQLAVPQHSARRRLSAASYTATRSAAGSFALPPAVALYGAPDCSEFSVERLSISRRSAARESSAKGAQPGSRLSVNLYSNTYNLRFIGCRRPGRLLEIIFWLTTQWENGSLPRQSSHINLSQEPRATTLVS
jgi:hypothetical protein